MSKLLKPIITLMLILLTISCTFINAKKQTAEFINWQDLENPFYVYEGASTKDACMIYKEDNDTFYIFFSAFYYERGKERSHVVGIKTKDFKNFSEPMFIWDGHEKGWTGMCSPNITKIKDKYVLTYNSWGHEHPNGEHNQLFYAVSDDLENWDHNNPIAKNLTRGKSLIDVAVTYKDGKYYLVWQDYIVNGEKIKKNRMAVGKSLDGDFRYIGAGYINLFMENGRDNGMRHENFEFIKIDDKWHFLSTDYSPHEPYLYKMEDSGQKEDDWLIWKDGFKINVPQQSFNTKHRANAAFLADWRKYDGYFYLIYAGNTHSHTHAGRGDNKLGLARSKDLKNWQVPLDD